MELWDRWQPLLRQQVLEQRPRERGLALVQLFAVVGVRHAFAGPECGKHCVNRSDRSQDSARHRRDVVHARNVKERLDVPLRQPEPSLLPIDLHLQQVARRLLLEPLACVPFVHPGRLRQLCGCQRTIIGHDPVETETFTDVHREEIERADSVHEQALDKGIAPFGRISHAWHRAHSCRSRDLLFRVSRTQPVSAGKRPSHLWPPTPNSGAASSTPSGSRSRWTGTPARYLVKALVPSAFTKARDLQAWSLLGS